MPSSDYLGYLAVPGGSSATFQRWSLEPHAREHFTLGLTRGDFLPGADPPALVGALLYEQSAVPICCRPKWMA